MTIERPILMSAPMVRALLSGTKTQTRRVVNPQPEVDRFGNLCGHWLSRPLLGLLLPKLQDIALECPYGRPHDRLYVREAWAAQHAYDHLPARLIPRDACIHYPATEDCGGLRGRPSIHMPRWATRIVLDIMEVRVERLQDISEADAIAEGVVPNAVYDGKPARESARLAYKDLWSSIHGTDSWDLNPYVWCLSFRRID